MVGTLTGVVVTTRRRSDSNWCGGNYAEKIAEDFEIRKYLGNRLAKASLSRIVIERTLKLITVTIYAARPGFIIGKGGTEVDKLKEELKKVTKKDVQINIFEVKRPEVDATIVADTVRGEEVNHALDLLHFSKKEASIRLEKLLRSAIANWEAKNQDKSEQLEKGNVIVKTIMVDEGRTLKRIRPCPQGRAGRIRKRSNHVTIILDVKPVEE